MASKTSQWRTSSTVCRCCLSDGCYKDISTEYFWMGTREVYSEMLSKTLDVTISYSQTGGPNSNSRLICETCITRLRDASDFKRQVLECEKMFMKHLDSQGTEDTEATPNVFEAETADTVKVEYVKDEKDLSDNDGFDDKDFGFDNDDDDDLDDEPLMKLATKQTKKESIDLIDIIKTKSTEKRKSTSNTKATTAKKAKTKDVKPSASKTEKGARKKDDALANERRNAENILLYTTAYPFRLPENNMLCVYCAVRFDTPPEFRTHMETEHSDFNVQTAFAHCKYEGYVKADCTDLACRICFLPFEKLEDIAVHLQQNHDKDLNLDYELGVHPFKLENDRMDCYFCERHFAGLRQLSRHLSSHYLKYTCETCGKSYISKTGLRQHIQFGHRGDAHICRKCQARFNTVESFRQHMLESKKCWMHVCNVCGERFRAWHLKERHLDEVHARPSRLYPCPDCDQVFHCRKPLRLHFKFAHTDEALICSYCGQKFDSKRTLDDHLPVHTQEKLYSCSICSKSFARKKNLAQHMWIHTEHKRFECVPCDKKFNQKVSWRTHMKSHHPEQSVA